MTQPPSAASWARACAARFDCSYPQGLENFVRINRSEIVNLDFVDGFEGRSAVPFGLSKNCYYIGKNPLYATGDYRQRMEGVFVKAAIKRGQKSLLILLSVSRLGRRPRQSCSNLKTRKSRPEVFS